MAPGDAEMHAGARRMRPLLFVAPNGICRALLTRPHFSMEEPGVSSGRAVAAPPSNRTWMRGDEAGVCGA